MDVREVSFDAYRVWKRNSLALYDLCVSHVLAFPALSLDFQRRSALSRAEGRARVAVALGTNTPA